MKKFILVISIGLFLAFSGLAGHCGELILNNTPVGVYFSPNGGCSDAIIKELNNADFSETSSIASN